jgi:hypothetical protein
MCDGVVWNVGLCNGSPELSTNPVCQCSQTGFSMRPGATTPDWGGSGSSCGSASQELTVRFFYISASPTMSPTPLPFGPFPNSFYAKWTTDTDPNPLNFVEGWVDYSRLSGPGGNTINGRSLSTPTVQGVRSDSFTLRQSTVEGNGNRAAIAVIYNNMTSDCGNENRCFLGRTCR